MQVIIIIALIAIAIQFPVFFLMLGSILFVLADLLWKFLVLSIAIIILCSFLGNSSDR